MTAVDMVRVRASLRENDVGGRDDSDVEVLAEEVLAEEVLVEEVLVEV